MGRMCVALLLAVAMNWSIALDGPWHFKPGDMQGADPRLDDAAWPTLSIAAPANANDGDQGISHFAAGWAAHGYGGYSGFAWYRIRAPNGLPRDRNLVLLGPAMVDSAYQIYVNGRLLGGIGDFSGSVPIAYG